MNMDRGPITFAEIRAATVIFLKDLFRHHRRRLALVYLVSLVSTLLDGFALAMIIPIFSLIGVGSGGATSTVTRWVASGYALLGLSISFGNVLATVFIITILQQLFSLISSWITSGLALGYSVRLRNYILDSVLRARWSFFLQTRHGDIVDVFLTEADRASGLVGALNGIVNLTLTAIIYSGLAFLIAWKIALILLISACVIGIAVQMVQRAPWRIAQQVSMASGDLTNGIGELIHGIKLVLIAGDRDRVIGAMDRNARRLARLGRRLQMVPVFSRSAFETLAVGLLCAALYLSFVFFHISVSALLVILAIFFRLMPRMSSLTTGVMGFALSVPFYKRLLTLCEIAKSLRDVVPDNAVDISVGASAAAIRFENVTLGYGETHVLRDLSLDIRANEIIGVAGVSGAGKSTLVDAIAGLLQPGTGAILIDGHRIETVHLEKWRRSIGYVTQDTFLLNGTLFENITLGDPNVSEEEAGAALAEVGLKELVDTLPDGISARIGPGGVGLSGGQRQRVGIARALVGRKKLIVFDEATSALDAHLERLITDLIARLRDRASVIVIAHRLSTLRVTDRIVVLEQGRIVEQGPWRELSERPGGGFHHMWAQQMSTSSTDQPGGQIAAGAGAA